MRCCAAAFFHTADNLLLFGKISVQSVEGLCDGLRQDLRKQEEYIQHAEEIERVLDLEQMCGAVTDVWGQHPIRKTLSVRV